jgi:hypothetical protein
VMTSSTPLPWRPWFSHDAGRPAPTIDAPPTFVARLDAIARRARELNRDALVLEKELREKARKATDTGTRGSFYSAAEDAFVALYDLHNAAQWAHEAGTHCAVVEATAALPPDATDDAYEAAIEAAVNARKL